MSSFAVDEKRNFLFENKCLVILNLRATLEKQKPISCNHDNPINVTSPKHKLKAEKKEKVV